MLKARFFQFGRSLTFALHKSTSIAQSYKAEHFTNCSKLFSKKVSNIGNDTNTTSDVQKESPNNQGKDKYLKSQKLHKALVANENIKTSQRIGKKPLLPRERLQAMLLDTENNTEDKESNISVKSSVAVNVKHSEDENTQIAQVNENKASSMSQSRDFVRDFVKHRLNSRAKIKPSQRLANMIPSDYWNSLDDRDTKAIIEELGDSGDSKKQK